VGCPRRPGPPAPSRSSWGPAACAGSSPGPALPGDPGVCLAPGRPCLPALPQLRAQLLGLGDSLPSIRSPPPCPAAPALNLQSAWPLGPSSRFPVWGGRTAGMWRAPKGLSRGPGAPHPQRLFLQPCLLSLLGGEGGFCLGRGTQAPAPHVHTEAPARQGRGQLC